MRLILLQTDAFAQSPCNDAKVSRHGGQVSRSSRPWISRPLQWPIPVPPLDAPIHGRHPSDERPMGHALQSSSPTGHTSRPGLDRVRAMRPGPRSKLPAMAMAMEQETC